MLRKNSLLIQLPLIIGALLFVLWQNSTPDSRADKKPTATVVKVNDGDTIVVRIDGQVRHVRLAGIDAPESYENPKATRDARIDNISIEKLTSLGKRAAEFTKQQVHTGDMVRMEFDVAKNDKYDRLLAYVYLKDGQMLNEKIVRAGFASAYTIPPNVKYSKKFEQAQQDARRNRRGLWQY